MKTIAIVLAGGMGKRFGSEIPKQYCYSILSKTISKFLQSNLIDAVQVVIRKEDEALYNQEIENMNLLPAVVGGASRSDSVKNGMLAIAKYNPELVLIHDANRPFFDANLIDQIILSLENNYYHGVAPYIPISETLKRLVNGKARSEDRENLIKIQTPQGFYFKQFFPIVEKNNQVFTDESSLAEYANIPMIYINGDTRNIKITFPGDLTMKYEIRTGMGFDAHKFSSSASLENFVTLGGIKIPYERKLEAHSDGDVLIHALVDALLGSIAKGDIGMHFPPSDSKWKGANSEVFLKYTDDLLKTMNASINNIDVTVICEKPHLSKYKEEIQKNIAQILKIDETRINIKATTTEKMGFTGRGEGIAVQAIATVSLQIL